MGYQESWVYVEPGNQFKKLIRAYEKAEQAGYYEVAGAQPMSVVQLKQPFGNIPTGTKVLWVCGDRCFHNVSGIFGGELRCHGVIHVVPIEQILDGPTDRRIDGIDLNSPQCSENAFMTRFSAENYAYRMSNHLER